MSIDRLDWDKMRVFCAVADLGSMNAAAASLGESPPTVSRKIDELERRLQTKLFRRSTRGVELTSAGRVALQHARVMADAADAIQNEVLGTDQPIEGRVSLVTGDGLAGHWIAPKLPAFHRENPKIELHLNVSDTPAKHVGDEIDMAIQFTEPAQHDLVRRRLGVLHYMFFATPDYLETYGTPSSVYELHNHRCIFHHGYVQQIERWAPKAAQLGQLIEYALVTNSGTVMREVCAGGGGVALLPSYLAELDNRITPLDLPEVAPIQFWLTYSERVRRLQRHRIVIEWVRSLFDPQKTLWFRETFIHPNRLDEENNELLEATRHVSS